MQYWLVKSEPDAFSWDQQVANGVEPWTGVRNHTAKLNLKAMKKGDLVFFYESMNGEPSIVGIVKVNKEHYQDPTTTESWVWVDFEYVEPLKRPVTLGEVKANKKLVAMALVRISRLSVQPVLDEEWNEIINMSKK